jgi:hypothetical protein
VLLLALTAIGVSMMRSSSAQERLAGASGDRSIAFQRAEAALRRAEQRVATLAQPLRVCDSSDASCNGSLRGEFADLNAAYEIRTRAQIPDDLSMGAAVEAHRYVFEILVQARDTQGQAVRLESTLVRRFGIARWSTLRCDGSQGARATQLVDLNRDGKSDLAYGRDRAGRLLRFRVTDGGPANRVVFAAATAIGRTHTIACEPLVGRGPGGVGVMIYLIVQAAKDRRQTLVAIWDDLTNTKNLEPSSDVRNHGWQMPLGTQRVQHLVLRNQRLIFTTRDSSASEAWLWHLDAQQGSAIEHGFHLEGRATEGVKAIRVDMSENLELTAAAQGEWDCIGYQHPRAALTLGSWVLHAGRAASGRQSWRQMP